MRYLKFKQAIGLYRNADTDSMRLRVWNALTDETKNLIFKLAIRKTRNLKRKLDRNETF